MAKGKRFGVSRARYGLLLGTGLVLLSGCSTEILFDVPAEREKKLADFYDCLKPASRGMCLPRETPSPDEPVFKPGDARLASPFRVIDPAVKNASLMTATTPAAARSIDFDQFVSDLEDPILAHGYALALRGSPQLASFINTVRPVGTFSLTTATPQEQANAARATKIAAFGAAVAGPAPAMAAMTSPGARAAAAAWQRSRDEMAASLLKVNATRNDPVRQKTALEADDFRARFFNHEGQAEIEKLAGRLETSAGTQVDISLKAGTVRDYYELARQVEQRDGWEAYKQTADVHLAHAVLRGTSVSQAVEESGRYAAFFKAYIGQYFRRGHFIRGYFFEDEFNKFRADYTDLAERLLRLEALPAEFIREFEEEIRQFVDPDDTSKDPLPDILKRARLWLSEDKLQEIIEGQYAKLLEDVRKEVQAKLGEKKFKDLTPAERNDLVATAERIARDRSVVLKNIVLAQMKRICILSNADRAVVALLETCLGLTAGKYIDELGQEYETAKARLAAYVKTHFDKVHRVRAKIDDYLKLIEEKAIVRKDVGGEKFVARNETSYQVPALEYRVSSKGLEHLKLEGDSYIPVIRDFMRVVIEAYFDARHGLPGASTATGVEKVPAPYTLPDIGKVAGQKGGYEKFKLDDFALVDTKAARIEALTSLGVATLVRGAGPLSIGNEALEAVIETVVSVAARKASEKVYWCVHACGLAPEQVEAVQKDGAALAARLLQGSRPLQSQRVRITVTHNPVGFLF